MNRLLTHAIFAACCLAVELQASDVESPKPGAQAHHDETGIVIHGTIFKVSGEQVVVTASVSRKPLRFMHGEGTVYVDEKGDPLTLEKVRSGYSVTVFYSQTEDHPIANRVIVSEPRPSGSSQRFTKDASP